MNSAYPTQRPNTRFAVLAITFTVHLAVLLAWRISPSPQHPAAAGERIVFWFVRPPPPKAVSRPAPPLPVSAARPSARAIVPVPPRPAQPSVPAETPQEDAARETLPATAPPSAHEMMARARRDLPGIDREIRKDMPTDAIQKEVDTPHKRMARGIARAAELSRPGFFEAPKITVLSEPGPHGRKLYRVTTAMGTYCMAQEGAQALNGGDRFGKSGKELRVTCPNED